MKEELKRVEAFLRDRELSLPSPPALIPRLIQAVKYEDYQALAETVRLDPGLSARILGLANSPLYHAGDPITSLEVAISLLGTEVIKNLALSFVVARAFRNPAPPEGLFDLDLFWKRAVATALAARLLARTKKMEEDHLFSAGLLADLGVLILYVLLRGEYLRVLEEKEVASRPLHQVEGELLGFHHAPVGAWVLRSWELPEHIYQDILYHHSWEDAPPEFREHAYLLDLALSVSGVYFSRQQTEHYRRVKEELSRYLGFSEKETLELMDQMARECQEVFSFFDLSARGLTSYSELIREAYEELERSSLDCALILQRLKEEKARAEDLARRLREANEKLRRLSITDGLTGLYNHRYFQERLREEFERARRYRRSLSLILLDLDHFKRVNDRYGHLVGDQVLRGVAEVIQHNIRKSDIPARYGGEEFAIIAPETDLQGASTLGERIREEVARQEFSYGDQKFSITVSLGVANIFPAASDKTPRDLIEAADKALYYSKTQGRNRLTAVIVR
ncbi:MAG TPA: GGDEF domain-containing protein [Thermosulfurimonas dismutans]|uniref:diguanylate cyclase n=1 Tax=Thermosulfurimonas dismutans TaxID=999894 RepID=A0A7C3CLF3_9BACT|nr:GGDEF domain-containing protein [Thermosulfurimonas dismutans]